MAGRGQGQGQDVGSSPSQANKGVPTPASASINNVEPAVSASNASAKPKQTRKKKPAKPKDERTRQQKRLDLKNQTINTPHVTQSAPFDNLPLEIRRMILPHLDDDPYAILSLQLVCKSWYLTLCTGQGVDADWQRRCNKLSYTKRAPNCKTWKESFLSYIKRRCIICYGPAYIDVGKLISRDATPAWLKVCNDCGFRSGHPFTVTTSYKGLEHSDVNELSYLKYGSNQPLYLASDVRALIEATEQTRLSNIERLVGAYNGNQKQLRDALADAASCKDKLRILWKRVSEMLIAEEVTSKELDDLLDYHLALLHAVASIANYKYPPTVALGTCWHVGGNEMWPWPPAKRPGKSLTWVEAIAEKILKVEDYALYMVDRRLEWRTLKRPRYGIRAIAYRREDQACQSRTFCEKQPCKCPHLRCGSHHRIVCETLMQQLMVKILSGLNPAQQTERIEQRKAALKNTYDIVKADNGFNQRRNLIIELLECSDSSQAIAVIAAKMQGLPPIQAELAVAREANAHLVDPKWHVPMAAIYQASGYSTSDVQIVFGQALERKVITIPQMIQYEVDRKVQLEGSDSTLMVPAYRTYRQACQAYVQCSSKPLSCKHRRCAIHHREPCDEQLKQEHSAD